MASKQARTAVDMAMRESGKKPKKPKKQPKQAQQQRKLTDGPRGGYRHAAVAGRGEQPLATFKPMLPKGTSGQPTRECPRGCPLTSPRASER